MKTIAYKGFAKAAASILLASAASTSFAASDWNWAFSSGCGTLTSGASYGSLSCNGTGGSAPTATITAWSTTKDVISGSTTSATGTAFATASIVWYGGDLAIKNQTGTADSGTPQHSMDNNGQTDMLMFSFGTTKVDLDSVTSGWSQNDADVSVLRYTGTGAPVVANKTIAQLLSDGWQAVGAYSYLGTDVARNVNTGNTSSSYWLVSAYNSAFGGTCDSAAADACSNGTSAVSTTGGNDFVKLFAMAGSAPLSTGKVPEPGSLALMGAGLIGLVASRRRRQSTAV